MNPVHLLPWVWLSRLPQLQLEPESASPDLVSAEVMQQRWRLSLELAPAAAGCQQILPSRAELQGLVVLTLLAGPAVNSTKNGVIEYAAWATDMT